MAADRLQVNDRHSGEDEVTQADTWRSHDGDGIATRNATILVSRANGAAVVSVLGELDIADRDAFAAVLDGVRAQQPSRIVVDLADVEFLGVPIIHVPEQQRAQTDGDFRVANAHDMVKLVLDLVEFNTS